VRKTSWYDAIQVIKAADGKLAVTIDWEWFDQYREQLLANKQASGKKTAPGICQRHLHPDECLLALVANTYGRKVGGRIWQDNLDMLLVGPPICHHSYHSCEATQHQGRHVVQSEEHHRSASRQCREGHA
jgi:hypothetical protein